MVQKEISDIISSKIYGNLEAIYLFNCNSRSSQETTLISAQKKVANNVIWNPLWSDMKINPTSFLYKTQVKNYIFFFYFFHWLIGRVWTTYN